MAPSKNLAPRDPGRDFVPYPAETLRFAAKALFHAYGTGPGARAAGPRARSIGMEQRLGRKSKCFWTVWNKSPAGAPRGDFFGRSHMYVLRADVLDWVPDVISVALSAVLVRDTNINDNRTANTR